MISKDQELLNYIPQRPPFVMVGELANYTENSAQSQMHINADNILVEGDSFTEGGLVENMAQTAALFAGYTAKLKEIDPPIGFIGAIKNLAIIEKPLVGETIVTDVVLVNEIMQVQVLKAEVKRNNSDHVIASCELRVFLQEEQH